MAHTLLLADDSVTTQRIVELTFAGEDVHVVAVATGQLAIERLTENPPDVLLADIAVPMVDGYTLARFVRDHETLHTLPVLLMAGAFDSVDDRRVQSSGASGILVKPLEPTVVISRVRQLLMAAARPGSGPEENDGPAERAPERQGGRRPEESDIDGGGDSNRLFTPGAAAGPGLRDAVLARLDAERGDGGVGHPPAANPPVPDAFVDEVAAKVAERLTTGAFHDHATTIIHEVAERLVREEIARIRVQAAAR